MFWKVYGRGVIVNISKLKSNIRNYVENEISTISEKPRLPVCKTRIFN